MLKFVADSKTPTIGVAMGHFGLFTRVLGAKFGSPFTYSGFNPDLTFAPGMPRFADLRGRLSLRFHRPGDRSLRGDRRPDRAQSLSPAVHNAAFRHIGQNKVMVPILVPSGTVQEAFKSLAWLGIQGISVTIPHKEKVIALLDSMDRAVESTKSCNTMVLRDGKWVGHNTDYRSALHALEAAIGGENLGTENSPLMDKQVLILGAGGVARSLAFGLSRRGAGVILCNRDEERALKLAEEIGCRAVSWGMSAGRSAT